MSEKFWRILKWIALAIVFAVLAFGLFGKVIKPAFEEVIQEVSLPEPAPGTSTQVRQASLSEKAPDFLLKDLTGAEVKLSNFLGQSIVLTFWTTWNQAAADQIKILADFEADMRTDLVTIITISSQEDKSVVANFMRRGGYEVKVLLDETGEVGEAYGAHELPVSFFVDQEGTVREIVVGLLNQKTMNQKIELLLK